MVVQITWVLFALAVASTAIAAGLTLEDVPHLGARNNGAFSEAEVEELFALFEKRFGAVAAHERALRVRVFAENLAVAASKNTGVPGDAVYGVTKFSALTAAEFRDRYLVSGLGNALDQAASRPSSAPTVAADELPSSFTWTTSQTKVMNPVAPAEGECGSTWAISAVVSASSAWALAGNTFVPLSVQQVSDCDTASQGCNGGWPVSALQYMVKYGLEPATAYPYHPRNAKCAYNPSKVVAHFHGWERTTSTRNETAMLAAVLSMGLTSVSVDAESWQLYTSGVIKAKGCGRALDHCVVITGWQGLGTPAASYQVQNVWGPDWGENGYANVEFGQNACGIAEIPIIATVGAGPSSGHSGNSGSVPASSSSGGHGGRGRVL